MADEALKTTFFTDCLGVFQGGPAGRCLRRSL